MAPVRGGAAGADRNYRRLLPFLDSERFRREIKRFRWYRHRLLRLLRNGIANPKAQSQIWFLPAMAVSIGGLRRFLNGPCSVVSIQSDFSRFRLDFYIERRGVGERLIPAQRVFRARLLAALPVELVLDTIPRLVRYFFRGRRGDPFLGRPAAAWRSCGFFRCFFSQQPFG